MSNPVLVEVTRGNIVESRHRGQIAVVDSAGKLVFSQGDVERPVFPRSAVKVIQGLPLVESGAADAYGFGDKELALACSSHSGEDAHSELALSMLKAAGRDEETLECGAHWAFQLPSAIHQARIMEKPLPIRNNCSGKHAGFICTCCHTGEDPTGYIGYDHPIQSEIRGIMESLTGSIIGQDTCGVDGCSIPTYAAPLKNIAQAYAKLATGDGIGPERAKAAKRLFSACMAEPFYVGGTGRACTEIMQAAPGRIYAKTGAEGVFIATIPEQGIAMAMKCEDGATRASECMVAATLARFFRHDDDVHARLLALSNTTLKSWNGIDVGEIRPAPILLS